MRAGEGGGAGEADYVGEAERGQEDHSGGQDGDHYVDLGERRGGQERRGGEGLASLTVTGWAPSCAAVLRCMPDPALPIVTGYHLILLE